MLVYVSRLNRRESPGEPAGSQVEGHDDRIDPARWRPLIMSFQHFFGLGDALQPSTLARIPESAYRPADPDNQHAPR